MIIPKKLAAAALMTCIIHTTNAQVIAGNEQSLHELFQNPGGKVRTSVYWYWMSGNMSKEGVIKDLEAMKRAGITRAYIGNIAGGGTEQGPVKIFSPEWWEVMHAALKKATELNIEIGIFNSPGWSQSGGPWIKPGQAMRYLDASTTEITGGGPVNIRLAKPDLVFQDVKVLAYPLPSAPENDTPTLTSTPIVPRIGNLMDKDLATGVDLPDGKDLTVDVQGIRSVRSLTVIPALRPLKMTVTIQVKEDTGYRTIRDYLVDRSNPEVIVGFKPFGPAAISLPETTGSHFRVIFHPLSQGAGINELVFSAQPVVESYIEKTLAKMCQTPHPFWDYYLWPDQPVVQPDSAVPQPTGVIDLTTRMDTAGNLSWDAPPGNWIILRTGMTPTGAKNDPAPPEATGLEVDKINSAYMEYHFQHFLGEIMRRIPPEDRKAFKVNVLDSYERGGQNWTDGFIEKFTTHFHYDPTPWIPTLYGHVVGSEDRSDRFLWDLRRFVADKVAYEYVGALSENSHRHGLTTWLENYGHWGFPAEFLQYGGQADEVAGEFWSEGDLGDIENRAASSAAHIYGKRLTYAESFTCGFGAFGRYPATMKARGDRFFTEGINSTLLHVMIEQPYEDKFPGVNAFFGNEFNRHNTWFNDLDLFTTYLKRCNLLLQQGRYVADVAYFIGEDAPKMTGVRDPELPKGFSYDYINAEVLEKRISVHNGLLTLPDGVTYRLLILPKQTTMRPELLKRIAELVDSGAVVLGPAPVRSPSLENYPAADDSVRKIAGRLWAADAAAGHDGAGIHPVGKGTVLVGMDAAQALAFVHDDADFLASGTDPVLFIHRKFGEGDIYFLSNQAGHTISFDGDFKVAGKQPELWDPVSGHARELPQFQSAGGRTRIPLKLEASESAFIVFMEKPRTSHQTGLVNYASLKRVLQIQSPWTVTFHTLIPGVADTVVRFDQLTDWASSTQPWLKYFSGTADYRNKFVMPFLNPHLHYYLSADEVNVIAKVLINGQYVGGLWTAPYRVDISPYLHTGVNDVQVQVTNTWRNRLIGDLGLPAEQRKTRVDVNPYNAETPLDRSGLVGKVWIGAGPN